jgi:MoaA/NifB/PqqE/SkfB family radical SAM enzyme
MKKKVYCTIPFSRIKINADGEYHSCCHQNITFGNIIKEDLTLEESFNKPILNDIRESVIRNELHNVCDTPRCPMYSIKDELHQFGTEIEILKTPIDLELALSSSHCNIGGLNPTPETACGMCPRASTTFMENEPNIDLTDMLVDKIKPYMEDIKIINIQGIAEPFWKGKVIEILDELDFEKYNNEILFWSFTNGTVFGEKIQDEFISKVKYANLGFSIDAATPETYKKIRKLDFFKIIERNIKSYIKKTASFKTKERYYKAFTTYNINMINLHEMEEMVRWSHMIGVDRVEFTLTFLGAPEFQLGIENLCNKDNWEIFWEGQRRALEVADELNFKVDFYVPFHGGFLNN